VVDSEVVVNEGDISFQVCLKILVGDIQPEISVPVEQAIEGKNGGSTAKMHFLFRSQEIYGSIFTNTS